MLISVSPHWLEVGLAAVAAVFTYAWQWNNHLANSRTIERQFEQGRLEAWIQAHWRPYTRRLSLEDMVAAPIWEEVFYRGLPILLLQIHPDWLWLAAILGLVLNVRFAQGHAGVAQGYFAHRHHHQLAAFAVGALLLAVGLLTGLLTAAIVLHSLLNAYPGGAMRQYRRSRRPPDSLAQPVEVHLEVGGTFHMFRIK